MSRFVSAVLVDVDLLLIETMVGDNGG